MSALSSTSLLTPHSRFEAAWIPEHSSTAERMLAVFAPARCGSPTAFARREPAHHEIVPLFLGGGAFVVLEATLTILFVDPQFPTDVEVAIFAVGLLPAQLRAQEGVLVLAALACAVHLLVAVLTELVVAVLAVADGKFLLTLHTCRMPRCVPQPSMLASRTLLVQSQVTAAAERLLVRFAPAHSVLITLDTPYMTLASHLRYGPEGVLAQFSRFGVVIHIVREAEKAITFVAVADPGNFMALGTLTRLDLLLLELRPPPVRFEYHILRGRPARGLRDGVEIKVRSSFLVTVYILLPWRRPHGEVAVTQFLGQHHTGKALDHNGT